LRHKAARSHRAAGGQQVVGALGAQTVGQREEAVGVPQVRRSRQRRGLMHDHLGLGLGHRPGDRVWVERVGHHRPGSQRPQRRPLGRRPGHPHYLVAACDELRDKLCAKRSRGAGDEHLHGISLHVCVNQETRWHRRL
jgi:hypothetical protein